MLDVKNFTSERTGRPISNQFIITNGQTKAFKSYDSIIVEQRGAAGGFDDVIIFGKNYINNTFTSYKKRTGIKPCSCILYSVSSTLT